MLGYKSLRNVLAIVLKSGFILFTEEQYIFQKVLSRVRSFIDAPFLKVFLFCAISLRDVSQYS